MSERLLRNQRVIDEFRSAGGVVGGDFAGVPLLLLTITGSRTGASHTRPLTYLRDGTRLVVFAANGGRTGNPGWYHNLLADPVAHVEVGTEAFDVTAAEADGQDRDRLWTEQLKATPYFADFQRTAVRRIPVITLTRTTP
jgi:deazaflavin-dependent oxidoreductase (nitroreductase family)